MFSSVATTFFSLPGCANWESPCARVCKYETSVTDAPSKSTLLLSLSSRDSLSLIELFPRSSLEVKSTVCGGASMGNGNKTIISAVEVQKGGSIAVLYCNNNNRWGKDIERHSSQTRLTLSRYVKLPWRYNTRESITKHNTKRKQ